MPAIIRHWIEGQAGDVGRDGDGGGDQTADVGDEPLGAGQPDVVLDHLVDRPLDVALLLAQLLVGRLGGRRQRPDAFDGPDERLAHERGWSARAPARRCAAPAACPRSSSHPCRQAYGGLDTPLVPRAARPPNLCSLVEPGSASEPVSRRPYVGGMRTEPPRSDWRFPGPARFDPDDDLVAAGADLAPGTLLEAYRRGLFPMPSGRRGDPMLWFSPYDAACCRSTACGCRGRCGGRCGSSRSASTRRCPR